MTLDKKSVLIVDDEPEVRKLISGYLYEALPQLKIVEASDGAEALIKAEKQRFHLIITDLNMPKMDGPGLIEHLGRIPFLQRPEAIFLLSDHIDPERNPQSLGPVTYLSKPLLKDAFISQVLKALNAPVSAPQASARSVADVSFINPFIDATLKVLSTTANTEATKQLVFVRKNDQISGDISAIIAMNSAKYMGSMAIAFEEKCFLGIVSKMLGEEYSSITPDIQDAAGELCNQVFGVAKTILNQNGHTIKPAIPSVIVGAGHTIKHLVNGPCIAVRFSTEQGSFVIEAVMQEHALGI